ncbi:unnamed protein product [Absidia cylindrospora]
MENTPVIDLKTQRYDRQLRLWATSELILPGIGGVTIVDDKTVDKLDIRTNFFLEPSNISESKAEAVVNLLKELNEAVETQFVKKATHELIHQEPSFFDSFTLIVASNLHESDLASLARICDTNNKILIAVSSKGLCGAFRIQTHEHTIIETHPENASDLRLSQPFKQLVDYVDTFGDLDALDQTDHAHVPFIVVLLIFVDKWKAEHNGNAPQSYAERNQLKENIRASMRTVDEENFEEAISNIWRLSGSTNIPSDIQSIFEHPACTELNSQSNYFWVIARAVHDFVINEGQGQLPLSGKLPDMKSDTKSYVGLQNAYRQKALEDLQHITQRVNVLLDKFNIENETLPPDAIETFCKNAAHIKLIDYRSIREELEQPKLDLLENMLTSDENMAYYIIFRAADRFFTEHQRYPGTINGDQVDDCEDDTNEVALLKEQVIRTLEEIGIINGATLVEEYMIKQITNYIRFRDNETANLAALMGGLVAQEAIKLITRQYIPINNTCVFNGIASTSSVFNL